MAYRETFLPFYNISILLCELYNLGMPRSFIDLFEKFRKGLFLPLCFPFYLC